MNLNKLSQKKLVSILQILQESDKPISSSIIAMKIQELGFDLSERTIRYYLQIMDNDGFTQNLGKKGRIITEKGIDELNSAFVFDKVGFIAAKIDTLTFQMNFSIQKQAGTIILNLTTFHKQYLYKAFKEIEAVLKAGLGMGKFLLLGYPGSTIANYKIDNDMIGIGTVCSVTLNGILLKNGITTTSRFGGVLEMSGGKPMRFTEIINYDGTSIDPLEIFIKGGMTSIKSVVSDGSGKIGASFREFPSVALPKVEKIKERLEEIGLNGILIIGKPGRPLLDIPVSEGRVGMVVAGGMNPMAAVEESGIPTKNTAMKLLYDFNRMLPYTKVKV